MQQVKSLCLFSYKKNLRMTARILTIEEQQQELYGFFGHDNKIIWDNYYENEKPALERKIKLIITDDKDNSKIESQRNNIIEAIWNQRKNDGGPLLMTPIFVAVIKNNYVSYEKHMEMAIYENIFSLHPLFRIRKCTNNENSNGCCMIFVDESARVYQTWEDYLNKNILPKGIIIVPRKGIYQCDENKKVILDTYKTPAWSVGKAIIKSADIGSTVVGIGSTAIVVGSLFAPVLLAPAIAGAVIVGIGCSAYSIARSSWSLFDRVQHKQSVSLANSDARGEWFGFVGAAAGVTAGSLTTSVAYLMKNGKDVHMAMSAAMDIAKVASMTANGYGVVDGFFGIFLKYEDNQFINTLDVSQLSSSLFLFTHSIYNLKTAERIIASSKNEDSANSFKDSLTNDRWIVIDKMVQETSKVNGQPDETVDIIQSLNSMPNNNHSFSEIYQINLNESEPKESISLWESITGTCFDSFPTSSISYEDEKLCLSVAEGCVDMKKVYEYMDVLKKEFSVMNDEDLENNILNFLEILSTKSFAIFMNIIKNFVRLFGLNIQRKLDRVVPFECFMYDGFQVFYGFSNENMNSFLENNVVFYHDIGFELIMEFYNNLRTKSEPKNVCKLCKGKYF